MIRAFSALLSLVSFVSTVSAANDLPLNFVKVSDGIYRGARPVGDQISTLARIGIRLDINLQGGDLTNPIYGLYASSTEPGEQPAAIAEEKRAFLQKTIAFFSAPLDSFDAVTKDEDASIDRVLSFLEKASAQNPVYLHCEHGKDRTGLVIALYRVKHDHWSPDVAHAEWERLGHSKLNQFMLGALDTYFWSKVKTF